MKEYNAVLVSTVHSTQNTVYDIKRLVYLPKKLRNQDTSELACYLQSKMGMGIIIALQYANIPELKKEKVAKIVTCQDPVLCGIWDFSPFLMLLGNVRFKAFLEVFQSEKLSSKYNPETILLIAMTDKTSNVKERLVYYKVLIDIGYDDQAALKIVFS